VQINLNGMGIAVLGGDARSLAMIEDLAASVLLSALPDCLLM
jgi:hypothetical protein